MTLEQAQEVREKILSRENQTVILESDSDGFCLVRFWPDQNVRTIHSPDDWNDFVKREDAKKGGK